MLVDRYHLPPIILIREDHDNQHIQLFDRHSITRLTARSFDTITITITTYNTAPKVHKKNITLKQR